MESVIKESIKTKPMQSVVKVTGIFGDTPKIILIPRAESIKNLVVD